MGETLRIGSDMLFPAEGVPKEQLLSLEQRQRLLERMEVPLDAQERYERTLERIGYKPVTELPNGYRYPSIDEWLALRAKQDGWTRQAPTMVRDQASQEIFFCKARVGRAEQWGGLEIEGKILKALSSCPEVPRFIHYEPNSDDGLELLITEAAPLSEFSVADRTDWTPDTIHATVTAFKSTEALPVKLLPEDMQQPAETIKNNWDGALPVMDNNFRIRAQAIIENFEQMSQPLVVVHGDTWTSNILV